MGTPLLPWAAHFNTWSLSHEEILLNTHSKSPLFYVVFLFPRVKLFSRYKHFKVTNALSPHACTAYTGRAPALLAMHKGHSMV